MVEEMSEKTRIYGDNAAFFNLHFSGKSQIQFQFSV